MDDGEDDDDDNNDEYIPLNAPGSTKFSVGLLDKFRPYGKHDATSFKDRMLYGKRVKRFTDAKTLQVYKKKQKAGEAKL